MSKVLVQIGFLKNRKKSQSVKAYLNDEEIRITDEGKYLTSFKDKKFKGMSWFMRICEMNDQDVLKIEVKTYLAGVGVDEDKTFEILYYADESQPVRSVEINEVGMKGYPLVKGKVLEIGAVYESDKRKAEIDEFLNEGFNDENNI
jgi:hypothetical protein